MNENELDCNKIIENLVKDYGYKAIPPMFAAEYHEIYRQNIPDYLSENGGEATLTDCFGVPICNGYERIVIGDYGAYVEFSDERAIHENLRIMPGQEYRQNDPRFSDHCKYEWWTTIGNAFPKMYHQKRTVPYADYRVGMWYISPFEVKVIERVEK